MMRVLAFLAVLGIATTAFGASIDITFCPSPTSDYEDNLGKEITLYGSDVAFINIWAYLEDTETLGGWLVPLGVSPTPVEDFTWDSLHDGNANPFNHYGYYGYAGNPYAYANNPLFQGGFFPYSANHAPGDLIDGFILNNYAYPYPHIPGGGWLLLATLDIHCTGAESVHDIFVDEANPSGIYLTDPSGVELDVVLLGGVTVNQIPEPASLALLALGGLALIRRR